MWTYRILSIVHILFFCWNLSALIRILISYIYFVYNNVWLSITYLQRPTSIELLQNINWCKLLMNTHHIIHQFITCQTFNEARMKKTRFEKKMEKVKRTLSNLNDDGAFLCIDPKDIYGRYRLGSFLIY